LAGSGPFTWRDDQDPIMREWLVSNTYALTQESTFPGVYVLLYQLLPAGGAVDKQN
jgi:hypothetical protein